MFCHSERFAEAEGSVKQICKQPILTFVKILINFGLEISSSSVWVIAVLPPLLPIEKIGISLRSGLGGTSCATILSK
jgi:hypothetical protein